MPEETGKASATRRGFIAGLIALPAFRVAGPAAAADVVARFRALSAELTGFDTDDLDPALARVAIDGFRAAGDGPALERLLSGEPADGELARRIAAAWYSGIDPAAGGPAVRTFRGALVWRALGYAEPPGDCSAEPGDWARPPSPAGAGR